MYLASDSKEELWQKEAHCLKPRSIDYWAIWMTEGHAAMAHSVEECPDPLNCTAHDSESMGDLAQSGKPSLEIEVHKSMNPGDADAPSLSDKGEEGEGLSEEDKNILKKILG